MRRAFWSFIFVATLAAAVPLVGQVVVDKTVATVSDGSRTELITRSDLVWQIALQRGLPVNPPRETDLRDALQTQINQRIFALEAERLPRASPTKEETDAEIARLVREFGSTLELQQRLQAVGFTSVGDPSFEDIIRDRVAIEKYIEFRFRSFVVITAEDEAAYYRDTWVPRFRREKPGQVVPALDDARAEVNKGVTEQRVAASIETFLEEAKRRVQITIISEPTQ